MSFKRNIDWVPVVGYGTPETYVADSPLGTASPLLSRLLLTPAPDFAQGDFAQPSGYPNIHQSATAKRIRGSAFFGVAMPVADATAGRTVLNISERVHLGIYDISDGTVATPVDLFDSDVDANERFLWERHSLYDVTSIINTGSAATVWLNPSGATVPTSQWSPQGHPYWSDVDVQANRRVNEGEALLYTVQYRFRSFGTPSETNFPTVTSLVFLRTLTRV